MYTIKIFSILLILININTILSVTMTYKSPPIKQKNNFECPRYCECDILNINQNKIKYLLTGHHVIKADQDDQENKTMIPMEQHYHMYNFKCINVDNLIKIIQYNPKIISHIYKLDLSTMSMKKLNFDLINQLYNLHIFNISSNQLIDLSKTIKLKQLTHIYMQLNNITTISFEFLPQSIKYIDLSYNLLNHIPENIIHLNKLQYINLIGNHLYCSCYNYLIIENLNKRFIIVDIDNVCYNYNNDNTTTTIEWEQLNKYMTCYDNNMMNQVQNDDNRFFEEEDEEEEEGSGDDNDNDNIIINDNIFKEQHTEDNNTDLNKIQDTKEMFDDDLNEYLIVNNTITTPLSVITTTSDNVKFIHEPDFYFNDTSVNKTNDDDLSTMSGSGDDELIDNTSSSSFLYPSLNMTSAEITQFHVNDDDDDDDFDNDNLSNYTIDNEFDKKLININFINGDKNDDNQTDLPIATTTTIRTTSDNIVSFSLPTEDDDEGSGSGSGSGSGMMWLVDHDDLFDDNQDDDITTTEQQQESSVITQIDVVPPPIQITPSESELTFRTVLPTTSSTTTTTPPPSSTTTTTTTTMLSPIITTTKTIEVIDTTIKPLVIVTEDSNDSDNDDDIILINNGDNDNINEEFGQVVKQSNVQSLFTTYVFVGILMVVLICLVGYIVMKRRVRNQQRSHNNNIQQQHEQEEQLQDHRRNNILSGGSGGNNGGGVNKRRLNKKDIDDINRYGTEMKEMIHNDADEMDKTVALLNQENELKSNNNVGVINEHSPMITSNNDDDHIDNTIPSSVVEPHDNNTALSPLLVQPSNNRGVEKVKITMTELTDSIPKTPVLITRTKSFTKDGPQIIVTPNLNQRPNSAK